MRLVDRLITEERKTDPGSSGRGGVVVVIAGVLPNWAGGITVVLLGKFWRLRWARKNQQNLSVWASEIVSTNNNNNNNIRVSFARVRFVFAVGIQTDHAALEQRVPVVVHRAHLRQ